MSQSPNNTTAQGPTQGTASPVPPDATIPEPVVPPTGIFQAVFGQSVDERNQLEKDGQQSHNIRRFAAYGALLVALLMYAGGAVVVAAFLGVIPGQERVKPEMWNIVVTVLAAAFTVPTVLVLAVLKSTVSKSKEEEIPNSVHEALGKMFTNLFDKLIDKIK